MLAGIERAFAGVTVGGKRPVRSAPQQTGAGSNLIDDTEQVHIVMGGRGLQRSDPRREALDIVNHVLGGGLSSRLFEEIRERRGLAYSVYSGVSSFADAGVFQLYAGTQAEHRDEVESLMRGELAKVIGGTPGAGTAADGGTPAGVTNRPGLFTLEYTNEKGETVFRKHWLVLLAHIIPASLLFLGGITLLLINARAW